MAEVKLLDQAQAPVETRYYPWQWHDQSTTIAYDLRGEGPLILLLPALSSISTRVEFNAVAATLAQHYEAVTLDWPGFGKSDRPAWRTRPAIYHALLKDFVQDIVPGLAGLVAVGHSAGYALALATDGSTIHQLRAIALVAPTWHGPLPTAMGNHRWAYSLLRWLV
ncbi:alpha/beta fold hydrolase [Nodosilinea sp. LEGE 07088]|uniref:alpha/beta fold hydrolase n=1 Tax=Nodosilinea sp. LEGE 07088 TaxID=2777968 RepID=UPI00187ED028|nr:alpha/beta fold hydrolase [Nodosilinea sp. LEGE 07088]MBE9135655.1 alpha/beta fold hydrolase [Nodosilinea sp. LEGE 07088]